MKTRWMAVSLMGLLSACNNAMTQVGTTGDALGSSNQAVETELEAAPVKVLDVVVGTATTCAVTEDQDLRCFGSNADGLLGHWKTVPYLTTPTLRVLGPGLNALPVYVATAPAESHSCAVSETGEAYCWGRSEMGQTGQGLVFSRPHEPRIVTGIPGPVIQVVNLKEASCALNLNGEAYCWGSNRSGLLGVPADPNGFSAFPMKVGMNYYIKLAGAGQTVCGITAPSLLNEGVSTVQCWGDNSWGQSGLVDDQITLHQPREVPLVSYVTDLSGDGASFCATSESGGVMCWGLNLGGLRTGNPNDFRIVLMPTELDLPVPMKKISVGSDLTCAISDFDYVYCWGQAYAMQDDISEGAGVVARSIMKAPGQLPLKATNISTQLGATCAVTPEQQLVCWGIQTAGRLGNGVAGSSSNRSPFFVNFPRLP